MIWKGFAALALLLTPAAMAMADGVQSEIDIEILIGRTEVMHDQTARGLALFGVTRVSPDGEQYLPADPNRNQYSRLTDAVVRYNNLRDLACGSRVISHPLCFEQRFMPLWYAGRARPDTSPDGLRRMAEDMQNQTVPLWTAVCERAQARSGDKEFCAIE
jgi:hypothetical protein